MSNTSLLNIPEFIQTTSPLTHEWVALLNTSGINSFTVILEAFDEFNNKVNFNNQKYDILVSNDLAYSDFDPWNFYTYERVMLMEKYEGWMLIRSIPLGTNNICINGWENRMYGADVAVPHHFRFVLIKTPEIPSTKIRVTIGSR